MTPTRKEKEEKRHHISTMHNPRTSGQRVADSFAKIAGSWHFIVSLGIVLFCWIVLNVVALEFQWDPYPFILLNFILSTIAAIQGPIILMSQNRQSQIDRLRSEYDYTVNRKAEREIQKVRADLTRLHKKIDRQFASKSAENSSGR